MNEIGIETYLKKLKIKEDSIIRIDIVQLLMHIIV